VEERCTGVNADCPADVVVAKDTVCRWVSKVCIGLRGAQALSEGFVHMHMRLCTQRLCRGAFKTGCMCGTPYVLGRKTRQADAHAQAQLL
jgi:hypothetical protein